MLTVLWWGYMRNHFGVLRVDERIILKEILKKQGERGEVWTGVIWLRIEKGGGVLRIR